MSVTTRATSRRMRAAAISACAAASLLMGGVVGAAPSVAAPVDPPVPTWDDPSGAACEGVGFLAGESGPDPLIRLIDILTGDTIREVPLEFGLNAIGYNPVDSYVYGMYRHGAADGGPSDVTAQGTAWRVGSDGSVSPVPMSGPDIVAPSAENGFMGALPDGDYFNGDVDARGNFIVASGDGASALGTIYTLAIQPDGSMVETSAARVQTSVTLSDFVSIPGTGAVWGIGGVNGSSMPKKLVAVNPTTGVVRNYGDIGGPSMTAYAVGVYADGQGNVYGMTADNIWAVNRAEAIRPDGSVTGKPLRARIITNQGSGGRGDAAQCGLIATSSLSVAKSVSAARALPGDALRYTIRVSNTGETTLTNVPVRDTLPAELVGISADNGGVVGQGVVDWVIPSLAPGAGVTLAVSATVAPGTPENATIVNRASVSPEAASFISAESECSDAPEESCASVLVADPVVQPTETPTPTDAAAPAAAPAAPAGELAETGADLPNVGLAALLLILGAIALAWSVRARPRG